MTRRGRRSRAAGYSLLPTPISSTQTTPMSSTYPSTYASEAEGTSSDIDGIPIGTLSLTGGLPKPKRMDPFPFLLLPVELRLKIYEYHFEEAGNVVDLDPDNRKKIHKQLGLFRTCRTIRAEASQLFYSSRAFRIFPTYPGRFFKTKRPLLARLTPANRSHISSLELRLGPGWGKPPAGWTVTPSLGLKDCVRLQRLTVFIECDPSDGVFKGFRQADGFYEGFCRKLLMDVLAELPHLQCVYFDAWSSVKQNGAMMRALLDVTVSGDRAVRWGPERGWTDSSFEVAQLEETEAPLVMVPQPVLLEVVAS